MQTDSYRKSPILNIMAAGAVILMGFFSILGSSSTSSDSILAADFANAGPDQNVPVAVIVGLDGRGTFIPNKHDAGAYLSYVWEFQQVPEGSEAVLQNADRVNPTFVPDVAGEYLIKLTARSTNYGQDTDQVAINAYTDYAPPVADAGPDLEVKMGQLVTLDASRSYDPDIYVDTQRIKTFTWYMFEAPPGAGPLDTTAGCNPTFSPEVAGRHLIRLWVEDDEGIISEPDEVAVNVAANHLTGMPVAIAGPDQKVVTGSSVQLAGTRSSDPDDRPLGYFWRMVARPAGSLAELSDPDSPTPTFTADRDGAYVVRLFVGNGRLPEDFSQPVVRWYMDFQDYDYHSHDRLVITASSENLPPVADAGDDHIISLSSNVTLDGSGSYDPEDDDLIYEWVMYFKPTTNAVPLTAPATVAPSFTAEIAGTYGLRLRVADEPSPSLPLDRVSPPDIVLVLATDNTPPVADAGSDVAHDGELPVTLDGTGSFDPDGDPLVYSWAYMSGPVMDFPQFSEPLSSTPSFTPAENGLYVLRLQVHDGELSSVADTVAVTVTGIIQPPELGLHWAGLNFASSLTALAFGVENTGGGSLTWSVTDDLPGWLAASPMAGANGAGEFTSVEVTVDRTGLADDTYNHQITVTSNGGDGFISVSMLVSGGGGAESLTIVPSLPWVPSGAETQTVFYLDYPSLGQVMLGETVPVAQAALVATFSSDTAANFSELGFNGWEMHSRTHNNPVNQDQTPSFILKRDDGVYFKITTDFTVATMARVQVDGLQAWRCGLSAGDCP